MTLQTLTTVLLPTALTIIMLGLGLTLTIQDFQRIWLFPKAVLIGLFCQLILLPAAAFALCFGLHLKPEISIGLIVLAASPGGVTSNIFSHLADGDVALNLTLTAINSLISAVSLPLLTLLALSVFSDVNQPVSFQHQKLTEFFLLILIPTTIGMWIKKINPVFAQKSDRYVRMFSTVFMSAIIISAVLSEGRYFLSYLSEAGLAVVLFNLISLLAGYYVPTFFQIDQKMTRAITFEIGIHNGALALYVAMSTLGGGAYTVAAAFYSILMYLTAGLVCWRFKSRSSKKH